MIAKQLKLFARVTNLQFEVESFKRHQHPAILLFSGKVLIAGGGDFTAAQSSAELYDPDAPHTPLVYSGDTAIQEGDTGTQSTIPVTLVWRSPIAYTFAVSATEPNSRSDEGEMLIHSL